MVEITVLNIALIALAAMFFGYGFGLFEGRNQGFKKGKAEAEQQKPSQPVPAAKPEKIEVDDPGLLRIKNENGSLTLDLDGARVNTASLSSDQRKRLIEMLNLMRPWLEGKPASAPVSTTPPPPQPKPVPSPQTAPVSSTSPAGTKAPSMAKEDRPVAPANSIVGQIDAILQMRLEGTPLEERGIFLAQSPEGGVMVYVGLTKYMGVEAVPDPEIKAAIRAAISEWESKYTPGL